ncbi:MAG: hypothetical protein QNJ61_07520 [Desulfobacterales bacterium]|nr:hypothetical protein [Desulfobacterales bacterium]
MVHAKSVNRIIALLVSIALIFTLSCAGKKVHPIPPTLPQEKIHGITVGDTVKVTTYSGEQYKFKVDNITREEIEGEGHTIALVDIASIKKVRFTGEKIAAAVGIIALLALLVWLGSSSESAGDDRQIEGAR